MKIKQLKLNGVAFYPKVGVDSIVDAAGTKSAVDTVVTENSINLITSGAVYNAVPTKTSDLTNDSNFVNQSQFEETLGAAKSEIKGNATSACDTLGDAEALITAEVSARVNAVSTEVTRAQAAETAILNLYQSLSQSAIEAVDTLPQTGEANKIYRLVGTTSYSDYMYNTDDLTTPILMATYNNAIDNTPTANSANLVTSGGVAEELALGAVYDVSAKNPTAGSNNDGKWESISALLSDTNLNTLIPISVRKGGMSVKFVLSSDNKYVQYRLMSDTFSTIESDWQGVDDEPKAGSRNLIESGAVWNEFVKRERYVDNQDFAISDENNNDIVQFANGHIITKNFNSSEDATEVKRGLMSANDKAKLNTIEEGAQVNKSTTGDYENDFAISDENNNDIVQFANGHIKTKCFDSSTDINTKTESEENLDFAISDSKRNDIVRFENGHVKTKNFDSEVIVKNTYPLLTKDARVYHTIDVGEGFTYQHPQDAINACLDASLNKQYMIVIHDDILINNIEELYLNSDPTQHLSTSDPYNTVASYIIMKDFVNICGENGRQVKIEVNIPSSQLKDANQNSRKDCLHCVYAYGSFLMQDIYFKCTNTRYCIHQENGSGSIDGKDANTLKKYINVKLERCLGEMNEYGNAYGVGLAPNMRVYMENCIFISHITDAINQMHTHANYPYPCFYHIKNCRFISPSGYASGGFSDLCSGKKHKFIIEGCEMTAWNQVFGIYGTFNTSNPCHDIRNSGAYLSGYGNKCHMGYIYRQVLVFSNTNNQDIVVDSTSSAYPLLFGSVYKKYPNMVVGCEYLPYNSTYNGLNMGTRLGNCVSVNKTLVVSCGNDSITFVFNKNYTNYTNEQIIEEMNTAISNDGINLHISNQFKESRLYFDDEVRMLKNTGNTTINIDDAVIKNIDGIELQSDDTKVYAISAERIEPGEIGTVILRGHQKFNRFRDSYNYDFGTYYKFVNNALQATTESDADFVCTCKVLNEVMLEWVN